MSFIRWLALAASPPFICTSIMPFLQLSSSNINCISSSKKSFVMAISLNTTKILLLGLWIFAIYSIGYLTLSNGTTDHLYQTLARDPPLLPGTNQPVKTSFIGIRLIDDYLSLLCIAFWDSLDGSQPHLSLFAFMFMGQYMAGYSLIMIEGARVCNKRRVISL